MFSSKEMQKLTLKLFPLFSTLKRLPLKTVVQMVYTDAFTIYYIGHIACFRKKRKQNRMETGLLLSSPK